MNPAPPPEPESGSGFLYAAIGCAVFLVVTLCAATGLGVYYLGQAEESILTTPVPAPSTGPKPNPGGPVVPGGPTLPPPPGQIAGPRIVHATVTAIDGSAPVAVGATCAFNVEQLPRADQPNGYWCHTQIVCAGRLLYGGPSAGFFPCTVGDSPPSVAGNDFDTTSSDTDAAMSLDTGAQTLTIRDDATSPLGSYTLTARVDRTL